MSSQEHADWHDIFERAEMRWMSAEDSIIQLRARDVAEIGREFVSVVQKAKALAAQRDAALRLADRIAGELLAAQGHSPEGCDHAFVPSEFGPVCSKCYTPRGAAG